MKRMGYVLLALLLVCMPAWAIAATWNIADGDIKITADQNGQTVKQGSVVKKDSNPVITGTADNLILVSSASGTTAKLTVKDLEITRKDSAIDIGKEAAVITVLGENTLITRFKAPVHVADANLKIAGSGTLNVQCIGGDYDDDPMNDVIQEGAAIGSNKNENMSGSITICGSVTVNAENMSQYYTDGEYYDTFNSSAAIGTGSGGDLSGSIIIEGDAVVNALCEDENGAGIGTGENGNITASGKIVIRGNAKVDAEGDDDGAGIGTGQKGQMDGLIHITGNASVNAKSDDRGAGIGTGEMGDMGGTILIDGHAKVDAMSDDDDSAGIGGGYEGAILSSGSIIIGGSAQVVASGEDEGTGIGAGGDALMSGSITIKDDANVIAYAGYQSAAIGADDQDEMTGTISILNHAKVTTWVTEENGGRQELEHGYIGASSEANQSAVGAYVISSGATINGVRGDDVEGLKAFINADFTKNVKIVPPTYGLETDGAAGLPATGDKSMLALWSVLAVLGSACAAMLRRAKRA